MESLDTKSYVYAFENATKEATNHKRPVVDKDWITKVRDRCIDIDYLCDAMKSHTNDSLGGESPYQK